jgi:peptidyl-prolyl cis-trans isomerase A (cyclophilin A)
MSVSRKLSVIRIFALSLVTSPLLFLPTLSHAKPIACFSSNMGDFCMELLDRQAPQTASNFINYINSGAYTNGIFHRSVAGFVVQGGAFKLVSDTAGTSISAVTTFPPVINEFAVSNTRGTVAMAKVAGNPNSATSQWFVNLGDNSANLDTQNSGFTVFAKILYNGMGVFDAIAALPVVNFSASLGADFNTTPTVSFTNQQVTLAAYSVEQINDVTAVFENNRVNFAVDIGNNEFYDVTMLMIATQPSFVFQVESTSPIAPANKPTNIATFSSQTNQLIIPSVLIDTASVVNNVLMTLSDPASLKFTVTGSD